VKRREENEVRSLNYTCRVSASALSPPYMPSTAVIMNCYRDIRRISRRLRRGDLICDMWLMYVP
jgi:hypothetical protein